MTLEDGVGQLHAFLVGRIVGSARCRTMDDLVDGDPQTREALDNG
jgi:hypothetical protein